MLLALRHPLTAARRWTESTERGLVITGVLVPIFTYSDLFCGVLTFMQAREPRAGFGDSAVTPHVCFDRLQFTLSYSKYLFYLSPLSIGDNVDGEEPNV